MRKYMHSTLASCIYSRHNTRRGVITYTYKHRGGRRLTSVGLTQACPNNMYIIHLYMGTHTQTNVTKRINNPAAHMRTG